MTRAETIIEITRARNAIDDAMPRECFPELQDAERCEAMAQAKNVADSAMHALDSVMKNGLEGMDDTQALKAWHSVCTRCLFNLEQAVRFHEC